MALVVVSKPSGFRPVATGELNYVFSQAVIPGAGYHIEIELNGFSVPKGHFYPDSTGVITCNIATMLRPNLLMSPTVSERLKNTYVKYQEVWDASSNAQVPLSGDVIYFYTGSDNYKNHRTQFEITSTGGDFLQPSPLKVWAGRTAYISFLRGATMPNSKLLLQREVGQTVLDTYAAGTNDLQESSFIAVGDERKILIGQVSAWVSGQSITSRQWTDVCYANGIYVAVSYTISTEINVVATSVNGTAWTIRNAVAGSWYGVCYSDATGLFVAVGVNGGIMTSPDGINWTARVNPVGCGLTKVCYGNGRYVSVSNSGVGFSGTQAIYSSDGITWYASSTPSTPTGIDTSLWSSVCFANNIFVAVNANSAAGAVLMTSVDGITWTARVSAGASEWYSVTFGMGLFVAVGDSIAASGNIMTSPDGITWTIRVSPKDYRWNAVVFTGYSFVAVSSTGGGANDRSMISYDGITWATSTLSDSWDFRTVGFGNGRIIAIGENSASGLATYEGSIISGGVNSEIDVEPQNECRNPLYLKWLNDYGGLSVHLFDGDQRYNIDPTQTDFGSYPLMGVVVRNLTIEEWEFLQGLNRPGAEYGDNKKVGAYVVDFTDESNPINVFVVPNLSETQTKFRKNEMQLTLRYPLLESIGI